MDPQYQEFLVVLGMLSRLVIFSILLERALAFIFEHDWFVRLAYRELPDPAVPGQVKRQARVPGLKGMLALGAALGVCFLYDFDVVGALFGAPEVDDIGIVLTAIVAAGGSAGSIAVFQGFLNMSKTSRDAMIEARKAEAQAALDRAQAAALEAEAKKTEARAAQAEAEARRQLAAAGDG